MLVERLAGVGGPPPETFGPAVHQNALTAPVLKDTSYGNLVVPEKERWVDRRQLVANQVVRSEKGMLRGTLDEQIEGQPLVDVIEQFTG
jgi:hypothetical protein